MCKVIVLILLTTTVFCSGLHREQEPASENKSSPQEDSDKYDLESRKDFDRTSEKEKEMRLLRKAKKNKENNNYRRTLESTRPTKNSESYRRSFDDLINNPEEKSKLVRKEADELVVPERRVAIDSNEESDSQVEEIEVIIERLSDDYTENDTASTSKKPLLAEEFKTSNSEIPPLELQEKSILDVPVEKNDREQPLENKNDGEDKKERSGQGSSRSAEQLDEHAFLEPYPISRISEVVIPHFRTTLTRSGVIVHPAVYTVQTSSPFVDRVTTRSLLSNRRLLPDIYAKLTNNKVVQPNKDIKIIEDYNDYNANAYLYAPSHILTRQMDKNGEALSQLTDSSLKSQLGLINPYGESLHPSALYSQPHRYLSDGYRSFLRISR